jgi:phosphoglycerate dehydrogenase-like enzyme
MQNSYYDLFFSKKHKTVSLWVTDMGEKQKVVFLLFLEENPELEEEVFSDSATFHPYKCQTTDEIVEVVRDTDAVITGPIEVNGKAISAMTKCKIIQTNGVGFDRIDLKAAGEKGIFACNIPDYCVNEVADHTIGLLLMMNRKLYPLVNAAKKGLWFTRLPPEMSASVMRLEKKTLGIIGLGRIGTAVAIRANAFGMRVLFYDPYVSLGIESSLGIDRSNSLDGLLQESDIVSIHTPLTDETYHMIQEEQLARMKKHAFIINTARGRIIDSEALLKALKKKWIGGAALDVMDPEPPSPQDPLLSLDNLLITPHRAYYSQEAMTDVRRRGAANVLRTLQGKKPLNIVNEQFFKKEKTMDMNTLT